MTADDYNRVYSLWRSCENMGLNDLDDSREGIEKFINRNPSGCFVAESGESVVGAILSGHDGRRGHIYHLAVDMNFRRLGIASGLVDHALSALRAEGINKISIVAFSRNETGNAFWEKQGFTARNDLIYRDKTLREMVRNDT